MFNNHTNGVRYNSLESLTEAGAPIFIVAVIHEAEAIANACRDLGIGVTAFCDSKKRASQSLFCGLEVIHTPTLPERFSKARFIIATQQIQDVVEQLSALGFSEFYSGLELLESYDVSKHQHLTSRSFMESRISVYKKSHVAYFDEEKTYMRSLDVMITTKCSLKCESCSNLMQYYVNPENADNERILTAIKILEKNVDEISEIRVIGGEPLMNKRWSQIVNGFIEINAERKIFIFTNGTILPKDEQLENFSGGNVSFIITDYGKLSRNIDKLTDKLTKYGISFVSKPADNWLDCSSIRRHHRTVSESDEVFKQCCVKYVYTLLGGRLYRCPFMANAANLKAIPDNPANYVDFFSEPQNIEKKIRQLVKTRSFFPGCNFCDGRPYDPSSNLGYDGLGTVVPGIQTSQPLPYTIHQ